MSTVDPITAFSTLLGDALAPVPVYGHELPDDVVDAMPTKALVVSGSGGPGTGGYLPLDRQRLDLRSYGATHAQAMEVAVAAHEVLKRLRRTVVGNALLHSADPTTAFITLREPNGRWPLVLRTYLGLYDEREVVV